MITEAMQGAAPVGLAFAVAGGILWRWMQSDATKPKNLGEKFTDATGRRALWESALSPKGPAKLRGGAR